MPEDFNEQILEAYPKLKAFALSRTSSVSDADDLVQATVVRALEKRTQFQGGSLIAWLITIAKNLNNDEFKKKKPEQLGETNVIEEMSPPDQEPNTMLKQVIGIINGLRGRCKELLILSAQGYKTREIAEWLGIPPGTAGREMMECRQKLDNAMNGK